MLTNTQIIKKSAQYVSLIIGLTIIFVGLALLSQDLVASIANHNTQIIIIASFVLFLAIIFQYKQTGIALENATLYKVLQEKQALLDRDLQMARSVQQGLIPSQIPNPPGFSLAARCLPAANIGGDFYEFIEKSDTLNIILGDVSGHGVSSALVMALTNGIMNEISQKSSSPANTLNEANHYIQHYLANNINFVTIFYAALNINNKKMTYSKGGHLPALLFKKDTASPQMLDSEGTVLGVFGDTNFLETEVQLSTGDVVIFYTDGLIEIQNS
ncbi:MAG: SpoIIE family protein phosphatase, partial [Candidatus Margulisbacteria bacterium]|nr:SpoIIE family protein phosphatase [Candidatus Margulisiibacteriota bacterium]